MMDARGARALRHRASGHATADVHGRGLDAALDELGWRDALAARPAGRGRRRSSSTRARRPRTSSALDVVLATAPGRDARRLAGVVLPALGSVAPPGRVDGDGLGRRGLGHVDARQRDPGAGRSPTDGAHRRRRRRRSTCARSRASTRASAWSRCTADAPGRRAPRSTGDWPDAVAAGQRALAHELVGASRAMLELARDHAVERIQFDRPIARFQAVRHRLAESLVAIEAADAAARRGVGRRHARSPPRWPRPSPAAAPAPSPATASRCWPASASPPSTRSTATSAVPSSSTACSATPARSPPQLGDELLATRQLPPLLPL